MTNKIEYVMHADALKLKAMAMDLRQFNPAAQITISAEALLSLIDQAHSAQLGLATTEEIRDELKSRDRTSPAGQRSPDNYRTFDPAMRGAGA